MSKTKFETLEVKRDGEGNILRDVNWKTTKKPLSEDEIKELAWDIMELSRDYKICEESYTREHRQLVRRIEALSERVFKDILSDESDGETLPPAEIVSRWGAFLNEVSKEVDSLVFSIFVHIKLKYYKGFLALTLNSDSKFYMDMLTEAEPKWLPVFKKHFGEIEFYWDTPRIRKGKDA